MSKDCIEPKNKKQKTKDFYETYMKLFSEEIVKIIPKDILKMFIDYYEHTTPTFNIIEIYEDGNWHESKNTEDIQNLFEWVQDDSYDKHQWQIKTIQIPQTIFTHYLISELFIDFEKIQNNYVYIQNGLSIICIGQIEKHFEQFISNKWFYPIHKSKVQFVNIEII